MSFLMQFYPIRGKRYKGGQTRSKVFCEEIFKIILFSFVKNDFYCLSPHIFVRCIILANVIHQTIVRKRNILKKLVSKLINLKEMGNRLQTNRQQSKRFSFKGYTFSINILNYNYHYLSIVIKISLNGCTSALIKNHLIHF